MKDDRIGGGIGRTVVRIGRFGRRVELDGVCRGEYFEFGNMVPNICKSFRSNECALKCANPHKIDQNPKFEKLYFKD
jgi:hypothetical protein